jgi:glycosyltransferase involved in cell wall biosynthesis
MLGVTDDLFLMAVAGRFIPEHSVETAIYVVDALPYFARLIVTGQGEQEQHLRSIARERVTFKTDPFAQQTAIAAADVVVVPSTVAGFSMTAVESMLQGTPVVMRRVGGLTEIAEDHRTGYYFETDEELLDLLNHLIYKKEQLREVGRAARQRAVEAFDVAEAARAHANLYKQVLA